MYKSGLVLEGGGLRAIYTSGVLDAVMEAGIEFPYVIGVSAGSCNGVSFLGKNIHRMRDITLGYSSDKRYMSLDSALKNGEYFNTNWVFGELSYDMFPLNYDEFEKSGAVFCVVATNAETGETEYFYPTDFRNGCEEIKASSAMPLMMKTVKINGTAYCDGGLTDSIPLKRALDDGCEKCVVVLTQDADFVKKPMGHPKLTKGVLKKYPKTAEKLMIRHEMYNAQKKFVFDKEKTGEALIICPSEPLNCPSFEKNPQKLAHIYELGYKNGKDNIERIKEFLK